MLTELHKVLEAAATTEKPFLDPDGVVSIELGLRNVTFGYLYLLILLTRACSETRAQSLAASRRMLCLLDDLVSDSEEVFNGIIWHLVCCPFTPFLHLFQAILSTGRTALGANEQALEAMRHLPRFLGKMGVRNRLAKKLEGVATAIVQHAESILHRPGGEFSFMPVRRHQCD